MTRSIPPVGPTHAVNDIRRSLAATENEKLKRNRSHPPRSGSGRSRQLGMRSTGPRCRDEVARIGPGIGLPLAARFHHGDCGGVEAAAFIGSGAEPDQPCQDDVAQRALGVVVCGWQQRIGDEGDDGIPIAEDFTGERAHLLLEVVLVALTVPLDAAEQALDRPFSFRIPLGGLLVGDFLDQTSQIPQKVASKARAAAVVAFG